MCRLAPGQSRKPKMLRAVGYGPVTLSGKTASKRAFSRELPGSRGRFATAAPLKIPDRLPTASQALRLRVACRALWPTEPIDSGDCGEKAAGRRQNEEK